MKERDRETVRERKRERERERLREMGDERKSRSQKYLTLQQTRKREGKKHEERLEVSVITQIRNR